jgi:hypothetical protein
MVPARAAHRPGDPTRRTLMTGRSGGRGLRSLAALLERSSSEVPPTTAPLPPRRPRKLDSTAQPTRANPDRGLAAAKRRQKCPSPAASASSAHVRRPLQAQAPKSRPRRPNVVALAQNRSTSHPAPSQRTLAVFRQTPRECVRRSPRRHRGSRRCYTVFGPMGPRHQTAAGLIRGGSQERRPARRE